MIIVIYKIPKSVIAHVNKTLVIGLNAKA